MTTVRNGGRRVTIAGATAVVAMVLGLAACGGDGDPVVEPAADPTIWEKITDGIGEDGSVSLDTALAAFSYAIAPLPGGPGPRRRRRGAARRVGRGRVGAGPLR